MKNIEFLQQNSFPEICEIFLKWVTSTSAKVSLLQVLHELVFDQSFFVTFCQVLLLAADGLVT